MFKIILAFSTILLLVISPVLANLSGTTSRDYYEGYNYGYNKGESDGILPLETYGSNKDLTEGMRDGYNDAQEKSQQKEWEKWEEETQKEHEEFFDEFDKSIEETDRLTQSRDDEPVEFNPETSDKNTQYYRDYYNHREKEFKDYMNKKIAPPDDKGYEKLDYINYKSIFFIIAILVVIILIIAVIKKKKGN